jgi:hypothetical protein
MQSQSIIIKPMRYIGRAPNEEVFFYGLSRNDTTGFITLKKINMSTGIEPIRVTDLSQVTGNLKQFDGFAEGVDFFEGRDATHVLQYDGLLYEQYKWSTDDLYYYVDEQGQLCVRINDTYAYPEGQTTFEYINDLITPSATDVDLSVVVYQNLLTNTIQVDLGAVKDTETTTITVDLLTVV